MRMLLLLLAPLSLACLPSQLATSTITPLEKSLELGLYRTDPTSCPVLEENLTATINGAPALFSARGGGSCQQIEVRGGSLLAFGPSKPTKQWTCNCRPAELDLPPGTEAVEVTICDGEACATVSWPGAPPLPTGELVRPAREGEPLVVQFTPALPVDKLHRIVTIGRGSGQISHHLLGWAEGSVTVPSHVDNAAGLTLTLSRHEVIEATCEGFVGCSPRQFFQKSRVVLKP